MRPLALVGPQHTASKDDELIQKFLEGLSVLSHSQVGLVGDETGRPAGHAHELVGRVSNLARPEKIGTRLHGAHREKYRREVGADADLQLRVRSYVDVTEPGTVQRELGGRIDQSRPRLEALLSKPTPVLETGGNERSGRSDDHGEERSDQTCGELLHGCSLAEAA